MKIKDAELMRKRILVTEYGRCERCGTAGNLYHGLCLHCLKQMGELYEENT